MDSTTKKIASINDVDICVSGTMGQVLVATQPIHNALLIRTKPVKDFITVKESFKWLLSLHHDQSELRCKENFYALRNQCFDAIFRHISNLFLFQQEKLQRCIDKHYVLEGANDDLQEAKEELEIAEESFKAATELTFEQWYNQSLNAKAKSHGTNI